MMWLHLAIPGPIPSGADGGNWLALAQGYLGVDAMASDVVYPPVFPGLLALSLSWLGSVPALVVNALIAKISLVLTIYLCTRPIGRSFAAVAALLCGVAGLQLEAFAWGGYPQLLGTTFGLLTTYWMLRWMVAQTKRHVTLVILFATLTFATHTLVAGLLLVAVPIALFHWLLVTDADRAGWIRGIGLASLVMVPGGLFVVLSRVAASGSQVTAVLNPYDVDLAESLRLATRDAVVPWVLIVLLAIAGLFTRSLDRDRAVTVAVGSGWFVAGFGFFFVTGAPRGLMLSQIGAVLLASFAVSRLFGRLRQQRSTRRHRVAFAVSVIMVVSMISAILAGGLGSYTAATTWYRVANDGVLADIDWIRDNTTAKHLMITSSGPNGNPLGWWVQGYGQRQTYTGIDPRALSFPDEREQAEVARQVFDLSSEADEVRSLLAEHGIDYLVVDRRGPEGIWLNGSVAQSLETVYESPQVAVLRTAPG
jgi:hypothetical protein